MAKGLRSSAKKANKTKLRHRVFAPVEQARKERLSAKLLKLSSQPTKAGGDSEQQNVDSKESGPTDLVQDQGADAAGEGDLAQGNALALPFPWTDIPIAEMQIDQMKTHGSSSLSKRTPRNKISKPKRGRNKSAMVFPAFSKRRDAGKPLSKRRNI